MDWFAAGGAAAFGLLAGLVGALVQYKLNERLQRDRDVVERERLDRQLAAQAEEYRSGRQHAELMGWRDRRFDAYRDFASRSADVESLSEELSRRPIRTSDKESHFLAQEQAMKVLRNSYQEVLMLSDTATREAATQLFRSADGLIRAAVYLSHAGTEMTAAGSPEFMKRLPAYVQRQTQSTSKEDLERNHELAFEMYEAKRGEHSSAAADWDAASRLALAVPD